MELAFLAQQTLDGKTIGRALFNAQVKRHMRGLSGNTLDLASGGSAGYLRYAQRGLHVLRTDVHDGDGIDMVVDIDQRLPFHDGEFDHVLLFNALYAIKDPNRLLKEMRRVVRIGGSVLVASPFLSNEMPEPHDYRRLTSEGLRELFDEVGYLTIQIIPYGERFSVMANLLHPFLMFNIVRLPIYLLAYVLDACIPEKTRTLHPAPIGYFCILKK